jgi:glycosyl transferase family 87
MTERAVTTLGAEPSRAPSEPFEDRLAGIGRRIGRARLRAVRHALVIVGLISLPYVVLVNQAKSMFGFDAYAYWAIDLSDLYGRSIGNTSDLGAFRYTPAFGQAFAPAHALPWELFLGLWCVAMVAALAWFGGRSTLLLLAFPPIPLELYHGNIHLFMAVAIVVGYRWPIAWAFILLSKVTPGVGVLWFLFRREWRSFAIAVGGTAAIAAVSYIVAPNLWSEYVQTMVDNLGYDPGHPYPVPIPLPIRTLAAAALVLWGARTDRRWVVPVAAVLALPIIWFHGLAVLLAMIPLWRDDRRRRIEALAAADGAPATATVA